MLQKFGALFTYDVKYPRNSQRVSFHRELFGSIHYGKNGPVRKGGILSAIPFVNPTKSCIIVERKYARILRNFFKRHKVKWSEHLVVLNNKDGKRLKVGD